MYRGAPGALSWPTPAAPRSTARNVTRSPPTATRALCSPDRREPPRRAVRRTVTLAAPRADEGAMLLSRISEAILGKRLDPFSGETRRHIALIAFLAWVGLGADGLSSSCYGPEEAFLALGRHTHLGLYMALATAITVFVIAMAYNQVIELFP